MTSDLDILIEELQRQVDAIKKEMDHNVKIWAYEDAAESRNAYHYLNRELTILKDIKDPNYSVREGVKSSIKRSKALLLEGNISKLGSEFLRKNLEQMEARLLLLRAGQCDDVKLDSDLLLSYLEQLIQKEEYAFDLVCGEKRQLIFHFYKVSGRIEIHLFFEGEYSMSDFVNKESWVTKLKNIGFIFSNQDIILQVQEARANSLKLLELCAQLIYDVFEYRGVESAEIRVPE